MRNVNKKSTKNNTIKAIIGVGIAVFVVVLVVFIYFLIDTPANRVSRNVSRNADNFNINRRVSIINTRTDKIEFEVIGRISVDTSDGSKLVIGAQTGENTFKKHLINLTEWNMYIVEDLEGAKVDKYRYEVNYMPESIPPLKFTKE